MFPRQGNTYHYENTTHITRDNFMCFQGWGTNITRDMYFPGRGIDNTRAMCFLAGMGTHITRAMCFPGRGTQITS